MKNISLKQTTSVILLTALGLFLDIGYSQADIFGGNTTSSSVSVSNLNIIGGYSSNYWTQPPNSGGITGSNPTANLYLFTQSPSFNDSIINNLFFSNYLQSLSNTTLTPTSPTVSGLNTILTATSTNATNALSTAMEQYFPLPVTPTSKNAPPPQNTIYNFAQGQVGTNAITNSSPFSLPSATSTQTSNVNSLNLAALLDPVQYGTTKYNIATNAENFIMYLSNQFNPTPLIDFTKIIATPGNLQQALGMGPVQQYLYGVRQMAANYSVGMSDLYYLYNQRVPQPTTTLLGNQFQTIIQSALPANLQKNASPLALEQWMATHRLTNNNPSSSAPTWLTDMENATPATLQREQLYLTAEIEYQMFQERMLQERILATLAAQQMQNVGSQQLQLQQLQNTICQNSLFSNANACPPAPQTAGSSAAAPAPPPSSNTQ